jgi:hypothetical protein
LLVNYNQLITFFEKNAILYRYQFGFRKGHSTEQAILELIIYMTKLLQSDWLRGVQLPSLIALSQPRTQGILPPRRRALSRSAINDFRDGWGEREIKTTKSNIPHFPFKV